MNSASDVYFFLILWLGLGISGFAAMAMHPGFSWRNRFLPICAVTWIAGLAYSALCLYWLGAG